jgi:formylglycine-generating enzyme required for sulfatase activity
MGRRSLRPLASLYLQGIRHAFRWMHPGSFMMGSPEDEQGRWNDEDLYSVTLSKGFWLGEASVIQALWQAIMSTNPSEFKARSMNRHLMGQNALRTNVIKSKTSAD